MNKYRPPLPKEHGAWALLYGSFAVAAGSLARFDIRVLLFFTALTALFLAHEPLSKLLANSRTAVPEKTAYWFRWLMIYAAITFISASLLIARFGLWYLPVLGIMASMFLFLHIRLASSGRERRVWSELLGVLSLTASAPGAYYVMEGALDGNALLLWFLNFLYFTSGVFYVRMRISQMARKDVDKRSWECLLYHALLATAATVLVWRHSIPLLAALAFVPILGRAFWSAANAETRMNLRNIGYTEVAHTILFVVLLIAGLRIG